ncbi:alpha/beta fold hydrolase [Nocardiopsis protaetiae]|uniref:alpha/beta fold hydrolase n=1 Tax=Nocardiopsis protaetiae TaxID=3382270 RepID=UPI00387B93CD
MERLDHETAGAGPALMLLPGTNSTARETWGATLEALAEERTLILPELPGTRTPLDAPIDPAALAAALVDAARAAGHERFALAGASLGAPIALVTAALHPDRVTHVVSVCGYSRARPGLDARLALWDDLLDRDPAAVGTLLLILGMTDEVFAGTPDEALRAMADHLGRSRMPGIREQIALARTIDAGPYLPRLPVPLLVVHGARDQFVHPAHSRVLAEAVPSARTLGLGGGHGLAHERAAEVGRAIVDFTAPAPEPVPAHE